MTMTEDQYDDLIKLLNKVQDDVRAAYNKCAEINNTLTAVDTRLSEIESDIIKLMD